MMSLRVTFVAFAGASLFTLSALASPLAAQQRVEVGNAASVAGDVTLANSQIKRPIKVERRQRIAWGDLIETGRNAQMQILLLDRSNFGIGQRSRIRIDRFVYDPNKERLVFATLIKGALRFFSGEEAGNRSGEISTPAGRIGIRGTAVDMLVGENARDIVEKEPSVGKVQGNKNEATLVILRGPAANSQPGLAPGRVDVTGAGVTVVLDQPGFAAYIPRMGAAPIGPFRIGDKGLARVQDELAPRWARSFKGGIPSEAIAGAAAAAVIGGILSGNRRRDEPDQTSGQANIPNQTATPNAGTSQAKPVCRDASGRQIPCPPR
jgi:hypothetical protein